MEKETVRVQQKVFDVDTRDDVVIYKTGELEPVDSQAAFAARLSNDSAIMLKVMNEGLRAYFMEQLKADPNVSWLIENEDGTSAPFTGTTLTEQQSKFLAGTVLNLAKMEPGDWKSKPADVKKKLKDAALDSVLAIPGFIDKLKTKTE